jgi:DNA repair protein RecO (recombination protein O)
MLLNELQPAFILHTRAYRDTSLLIEFFTKDEGRIAAVAKGARSARSPWRGLLLPGMPLLITCKGKHELLTLTQAEPNGTPLLLQGHALFSQFYLNELLSHVLQRHDAHPHLYELYQYTLQQLTSAENIEIPLRIFELELVRELGYGVNLYHETATHQAVQAEQWYHFSMTEGVVAAQAQQGTYLGSTLLALSNNQLSQASAEILRDAKRLTRQMIDYLLDGKELCSRELFK